MEAARCPLRLLLWPNRRLLLLLLTLQLRLLSPRGCPVACLANAFLYIIAYR